MNKKYVKIILYVVLCIIIFASGYFLGKNQAYQSVSKEEKDFIGTFKYAERENSMASTFYVAVMRDGDNIRYLEYNMSTEEVIQEGSCVLSEDNYLTLCDREGNPRAYLAYVTDHYLYFGFEKGAMEATKISEGPVMPTHE